jgi:predicted membrane protein
MAEPGGEVRIDSGTGRRRKVIVHTFGPFWIGMVFLALGVLWTLDNLGLMDAGDVIRFWPAILVALGLMKLTGVGGTRQTVAGAILTGAGSLLLLNNLDLVDFGIEELWAVGLIFIGSMIVYRSIKGREERASAAGASMADRLNALAIMAGVERRVDSQAFRGGEMTAVMGSVEVDCRNARIEGGQADIEMLCIMGGIEILVPADWQVEVEAMPVMGAIEDQRRAPTASGRQKLVLRGFVMMGGVEIKDAPEKT